MRDSEQRGLNEDVVVNCNRLKTDNGIVFSVENTFWTTQNISKDGTFFFVAQCKYDEVILDNEILGNSFKFEIP